MSASLRVNEIYLSLQGESTWAGLPCVFVRLTGCPLRCSYCDTAYAFTEGTRQEIGEVMAEVERLAAGYSGARTGGGHRLPLVELTGGEPLAQAGALPLMEGLCDRGYTVLLETSGALDIGAVDRRVIRIVDLKSPSSGEEVRNRWSNLAHLRATDEVKLVLGTWEDYAWAKELMEREQLASRCVVLVSWVHPLGAGQGDRSLKPVPAGHRAISRLELAEAIIGDRLPVRFQVQMHKVIWEPAARGV